MGRIDERRQLQLAYADRLMAAGLHPILAQERARALDVTALPEPERQALLAGAAPRSRGTPRGVTRKITGRTLRRVWELKAQDVPVAAIARRVKLSRQMVHLLLNDPPPPGLRTDPAARFRLLFGPYHPLPCEVGQTIECRVRGPVVVVGFAAGPLRWPLARRPCGRGTPFLVVCGDLVTAVQRESALAVGHWWGVKSNTVWTWKKALGVPAVTDGTRRLHRDWMPERLDDAARARQRQAWKSPERAAKIAAAKRGKPRPPHVQELLRTLQVGRTASAETRRKLSEAHKRRRTKPAGRRARP